MIIKRNYDKFVSAVASIPFNRKHLQTSRPDIRFDLRMDGVYAEKDK